MPHFYTRFFVEDIGKQTVVWPDKEIARSGHQQGPPAAPDAGIHYGDMHGSVRKVAIAGFEQIGGLENIVRSNVVRQIDKMRLRIDVEDDALHARHEIVA